MASDGDSLVSLAEVRTDFAAVPAKDKKLAVVVSDSAAHGVEHLDGTEAAVAKPALLTFLDKVTAQ